MTDLRKAAEMVLEALEALWDILDDIDTASDMAKENDAWYRKRVEALQKKRWDTMITTDGYKLRGGPVEALRQALRQALNDKPPVKTYAGGRPNYCTQEYQYEVVAEHADGTYTTKRIPKRDSSSWVDCTDEQLMEEVRRRGFVIRDAQIGREWVGLTGLEQKELMAMNSRYAVFETEAKLKEKNGG